MPRTARASAANYCYHVLNRGNARAEVLHNDADYEAFLALITEASLRRPMRLLGYCRMPNHFHLALWPEGDGDLSRWMHWLLTAHVRRYLKHYHSSGHVWQGRFKAFPIQEDANAISQALNLDTRNSVVSLERRCPRNSQDLQVISPMPPISPRIKTRRISLFLEQEKSFYKISSHVSEGTCDQEGREICGKVEQKVRFVPCL
jgi:REP element-mobilizing transposase RayT